MLPFTADVLFASLEQYNRALWPWPVVAWLLGLVSIVLTLRPVRSSDHLVSALLVAAWIWTGYGYLYLHHASLNFAAPIYAGFFILEGVGIAVAGVLRGRIAFRFQKDLFGWVSLALAALALLWPLVDWLFGHGLASARVVGLSPAPTAVLTLALLLMAAGRTPVHLLVIPVLWTLVAGATAWVLGITQDLALPPIGLAAVALVFWKNRKAGTSRRPSAET